MTSFSNLKQTTDFLANQIKNVKDKQGDLTSLNTAQSGTIVAAINSLKAALDAVAGDVGAQIDDTSTAADKTFSAQKILAEITASAQATIAQITGGTLDAAKDQLIELLALIENNEGSLLTIIQTQANRVAFDTVQNKNETEKAQARANMGAASADDVGDTSIDFLASATLILA